MFYELCKQRARVTASLCCQELSCCGKPCIVPRLLLAFFLWLCAGCRLWDLPYWLGEADGQDLVVSIFRDDTL